MELEFHCRTVIIKELIADRSITVDTKITEQILLHWNFVSAYYGYLDSAVLLILNPPPYTN